MIFTNQGMRISNIETYGWKNAVRGMRYPMNSELQSDSMTLDGHFELGIKDKDLLLRLTKAGTDHRKILRMIHISASVKMPLTFWKQYDTYKISTTAISRSTMHRGIGGQPLSKDEDFFFFQPNAFDITIINQLNELQKDAQNNTDPERKRILWEQIIDLLPNAYCQERMIEFSYETAINFLGSRYQVEKLNIPWNFFCEAFLQVCPYLLELYEAVKSKRTMTMDEFAVLKKKI